MRIPGLAIGIFALLTGSVAGAGANDNLVLHRPYDMWPAPNYGGTLDEEGDPVHLTDGYTNYTAGRIWGDKPTVGWSHPLNEPVLIWFDLEQPATLSELRFYTTGGGGAGVVDVGLRVYASLDDENYVVIGERPPPSAEEADQSTIRGLLMTVPLHGAKARYVAIAAMAPPPFYFVFVDEVELYGTMPADPASILPIRESLPGSGARELQEILAGGRRASWQMESLLAPAQRHMECWPAAARAAQEQDVEEYLQRSLREPGEFESLRAEATERHRLRAREVYQAETLVWEVIPDDRFGLISLPETLTPAQQASVDTVVNALEATALGAANLTDQAQPLTISVSAGGPGAPSVTPRVGRFFVTTNARYVPDALIATDSPVTIPSGESRLIWLSVESEDTPPGVYDYQVSVGIGEALHTVPLAVRVHEVVLSKSTPLYTGNWSYLNDGRHPVLSDLREVMLRYRLTLGECSSGAFPIPEKDADGNLILPMELDFTALEAALEFNRDFPQMSWFWPYHQSREIPSYDFFGKTEWMSEEYQALFREWLRTCLDYIIEWGRDYDEFHLMFFDETTDPMVAEVCRLVKSVDPRIRVKITIPQASEEAVRELVEAGMDIHNYHSPRLSYDNAPDGFPLLRTEGRQLWLYHAADAAAGVGRERDPIEAYRLLHWLAFYHEASGVCFWNMYSNQTSGWIDGQGQVFWPQVYLIAEGFPPPPPDVQTAETVIPSRRWEYQRMGIEDYMLLTMAQERLEALGPAGEEYGERLDSIVDDVLRNRAQDRELFHSRRLALVALVEELESLSDAGK